MGVVSPVFRMENVTATKDGYTVQSAKKKLTVTKPNLSNAEITFPYGNEAAFNSVSATGVPMFVVTYNGTKLEENVDFVITRGASTYDVGPCTLTIKATDNGDYTGSKSAEWTVRPLKVAASVGDIIKTYDGTTDLPANAKITLRARTAIILVLRFGWLRVQIMRCPTPAMIPPMQAKPKRLSPSPSS